MTLYESPQVQQWRIEYAELREEFGTELSEFEFVAQKAADAVREKIRWVTAVGSGGASHLEGCGGGRGVNHGYSGMSRLSSQCYGPFSYDAYPHKQSKEQE